MQSKRKYKDAAGREIKLPKEVYYRCLWTVRDAGRLRGLADLLRQDENVYISSVQGSQDTCQEPGSTGESRTLVISDETARRAAADLACIEKALTKVPEVYREELLDNIMNKKPLPDFAHANTWKRWKLVFLYELAREMRLV